MLGIERRARCHHQHLFCIGVSQQCSLDRCGAGFHCRNASNRQIFQRSTHSQRNRGKRGSHSSFGRPEPALDITTELAEEAFDIANYTLQCNTLPAAGCRHHRAVRVLQAHTPRLAQGYPPKSSTQRTGSATQLSTSMLQLLLSQPAPRWS